MNGGTAKGTNILRSFLFSSSAYNEFKVNAHMMRLFFSYGKINGIYRFFLITFYCVRVFRCLDNQKVTLNMN